MKAKTTTAQKVVQQSKDPLDFMHRIEVSKTQDLNEVKIFLDDFERFMKMMSMPPAVWKNTKVHVRNRRKGRGLDPDDPAHKPLMFESKEFSMKALIKEREKDKWRCTDAQRKAGISCFVDQYKVSKELESRIDKIADMQSKMDAEIAAMIRKQADPKSIKEEKKKWNEKIKKELGKKVDLMKLDEDGNTTPIIKEMFLPAMDTNGNVVNFTKESGLLDEEGVFTVFVKNRDGSLKKDKSKRPIVRKYVPDEKGRFSCTSPFIEVKNGEEHVRQPIQKLQIRISGPIKPVKAITDAIIELNKKQPDIFKDPRTNITWGVTEEDLGLSKMFVEKSDRENGAICSDTIRAYFGPEGERDD